MALLLLNRRPILSYLPHWLPGVPLVVVTARSAVSGLPPGWAAGRDIRVETVDDYTAPAVDRLIEAECAAGGIERVLSVAEADVIRAARARARYGLPGQSVASALAYRDKRRMKRAAARHGVPVAPMALVRDRAGLAAFADAHGLPAVVKPAAGAGSVGVSVLHDRSAVGAYPFPAGGTRLVERFVEGTVCHVDGLMAGGAVLHGIPSRYLHTNLATATRAEPSVSGMLDERDPLAPRLLAATADVVAALPPVSETTAFHAEFFHTPDDRLVLCEIACRPGGCGIPEAYELSTGVNLYAAHLRGQAGFAPLGGLAPPAGFTSPAGLAPPAGPPGPGGARPRHGWGWFPPRDGVLERLPPCCPLPGAVRFARHGEPGSRHRGPASSTDRVAELVFRLDGDRSTEAQLREVADWWEREARWAAA
ncbi:ATP-grasp domain-containing protein [Streptomyces katsurahamanus]|uniref:ATP-grasp domain-containing protein n=1 Tax=Streptomyces katsurahamanus TaxID=2577098 RepID=A0ABW9NZ30_9ACTN|nr:hypothetical protein [Streptomyces katsurahamanus]MQS38538.1 hypothetical protein [Streptomyces katsurahamanus]